MHLLCFGTDPALLRTRQAVLRKSFAVTVVNNLLEMEALPHNTDFDAVVLCHSLSELECEAAVTLIQRRWPDAAILALTGTTAPCRVHLAVQHLSGFASPEALLAAVRGMLRRSASQVTPV